MMAHGWRAARFMTLPIAICIASGVAAEEPAGIGYVSGLAGPEDIVALPGTRWLVANSMQSGKEAPDVSSALFLVDRKAKTARRWPIAISAKAKAYSDCPAPPSRLLVRGLALRQGPDGGQTLFAVNGAGRESVEVFSVDMKTDIPAVRWIGCVVLPQGSLANSVAPLPDDGFVVTLMNAPEYFNGPANFDHPDVFIPKWIAGEATGYAMTWRKPEGLRKLAGTEGSAPNGIEVSPDGRSAFVALWGSRRIVKVPLGSSGKPVSVSVDFMPDNLHWGKDGRLWVAGASEPTADVIKCSLEEGCKGAYRVASLDPGSLSVRTLALPDTRPRFGDATAALHIQGVTWIAASTGDSVAFVASGKRAGPPR